MLRFVLRQQLCGVGELVLGHPHVLFRPIAFPAKQVLIMTRPSAVLQYGFYFILHVVIQLDGRREETCPFVLLQERYIEHGVNCHGRWKLQLCGVSSYHT